MDGEEEGEAEESDDDEVDEANAHSRCNIRRTEGTEIKCSEADGWGHCLRYSC